MNTQIITPQEWQTQPWKNGGGVTHELISEKDAKGILWRVSIAEVRQNGPFSLFPGIDRIILLLEGAGFSLKFQESQSVKNINYHYEPFSFAGEEMIECALLGGSVRDFNVMTRRGDLRATVEVLNLKANTSHLLSLSTSTKHLFYVAAGSIIMCIDENQYIVKEKEMLVVELKDINAVNLLSQHSGATIFFINITVTGRK
ncbi:MAG: hypothetical protein A3F67_08990 [Verrucomicrobia bacterium RIFCSPHIGHO2_12_FULL_41_10]|nr:MAG: hypothetical protein A3F67_08990 [Verrucomicrobia bacterium RIFCSPHIGHO2_12_FULL_41_10]HLB33080.1 HutD family protein [Chthoniobacterales bacterium]